MAKTTNKYTSTSQSQQPIISTFFSQRPSPTKSSSKRSDADAPIDLTLEDADNTPPPKKKQKISGTSWGILEPSARDAEAGPSRKYTGHAEQGHAEQWRFEPVSAEKPRPEKKMPTADHVAARKKTQEAFKKRLLGENSIFIRKESRESSEGAIDVDSEDNSAADDDDSDAAFAPFREELSNPRGKGKAPATRKKKVEEVGPSGQTWTPLEKQVRRT